jgi:hypothetical protein
MDRSVVLLVMTGMLAGCGSLSLSPSALDTPIPTTTAVPTMTATPEPSAVVISAEGVDCRADLSQAECDHAVQVALQLIPTYDEWLVQANGSPIRLTEVWKACTDADCMADLAGFAFVRVTTDEAIRLGPNQGMSLGTLVICIVDDLCGGQRPFAYTN